MGELAVTSRFEADLAEQIERIRADENRPSMSNTVETLVKEAIAARTAGTAGAAGADGTARASKTRNTNAA